MARQEPTAPFHQDPLRFIGETFPDAGDAVWWPGRELLLSEAGASRAVLTNEDGLYEDHSDFFHTRRGLFGPRSLQVEMGRSARALLRSYVRAHAGELPERIDRTLAPASDWPDAGNWLIYRHLGPALVAPDSPPGCAASWTRSCGAPSWSARRDPTCRPRNWPRSSCRLPPDVHRYRIQLSDPEAVRMALVSVPLPRNFRGTITQR